MTETLNFKRIDAGDYTATSHELNRQYRILSDENPKRWLLNERSLSTDQVMRNTHTLTKAHAVVIAQDWVTNTIEDREHVIRSEKARKRIVAQSSKIITDQLAYIAGHDYDFYDRPGNHGRGSWKVFLSDVVSLLGKIRDHQKNTVFADLDTTILLNTLYIIELDTQELLVSARIHDVTLTIIDPISELAATMCQRSRF